MDCGKKPRVRRPHGRRALLCIWLAGLTAGAVPDPARAQNLQTFTEVTVNTALDTSPAALCSLRAAIASITNESNVDGCVRATKFGSGPDTIRFGSEVVPGQIILNGTLFVSDSLRILGPGADLLEINGQNLHRIFQLGGQAGRLTLEDMTLTQGYASDFGGAVFSEAPPLTLRNMKILNSEAVFIGGGIATNNPLELFSVTVSGNSANTAGGVYAGSDLIVHGSEFLDNSAVTSGGALFLGNTPLGDPNVASERTISSSAFERNTAATGGAVLVENQTSNTVQSALIEGSTFLNNRATSGEGSALAQIGPRNSLVRIVESLLVDDLVSRGEWQLWQATLPSKGLLKLNLENSTVTGNDGISGSDSIDVLNSTVLITPPQASAAVRLRPATTTRLRDSILISNGFSDCFGSSASIIENRANLFFDGDCATTGSNVISADPMLGPLQDNGGPTLSMAPLPGSPAIDAGSIFCPATDQRGFTRLDAFCDIGAIELGGTGVIFKDGLEP